MMNPRLKELAFFYHHEEYGHQERHIAYTEWGDENNEKVVFCVHGITRNSRDFDYFARALQNDYRIICPDVAGRGRSSYLKNPAQYNYSTYIADMYEFIRHLNLPSVYWVGTSMGGYIGMFLNNAHKHLIKAMVLNDIGPHIPKEPLQRIAKYIGLIPLFKSIDDFENHIRKVYAPFSIEQPEHWKHMAEHSHKIVDSQYTFDYDPQIAATFQQGKFDEDIDLWALWRATNLPMLVLRGEVSDILTRESYYKMLEKPGVTGVEIMGVGHAPALMDDYQISIVKKWLDGVSV